MPTPRKRRLLALAPAVVLTALSAGPSPSGAANGCAANWSGRLGSPPTLPAKPNGYYLWHTGSAWHLRAGSRTARTMYVGTLRASGLRSARLVRAERADRLTRRAGSIAFRLSSRGGDVDGLDFKLACGDIGFELGVADALLAPSRIHLGRRSIAPAREFRAGDNAETGVHGQVLRGPTCPVEGAPECQTGSTPVVATVEVRRAPVDRDDPRGDELVGTADTDGSGHFSLKIAPGHYVVQITKVRDGSAGTPVPTAVDIVSGLSTAATVVLDSGIRGPQGGAPQSR